MNNQESQRLSSKVQPKMHPQALAILLDRLQNEKDKVSRNIIMGKIVSYKIGSKINVY